MHYFRQNERDKEKLKVSKYDKVDISDNNIPLMMAFALC